MKGMRRPSLSVLGVLSLGFCLAVAQDAGQDARGRQVLEAVCSGCHELDTVYQARRNAVQWAATVDDMIARGAPVLEGERDLIVQFLSANYSAEARSGSSAPAAQAASTPATPATAMSPEVRGRQVLMEACTVCHELDFVYQSRRTRSEWEETVGDMMGRGALLLEGERELLLDFLATRYGRPNATSVNEASAQQLMTAFGLTQSEADAVIRYKQEHGVILGWEDLRKIPGLDVKKFEAKRELLAFY